MYDCDDEPALAPDKKECAKCGAPIVRRQRERKGKLQYTESVQSFAVRTYCSRRCSKYNFAARTRPRAAKNIELTQDVLDEIRRRHAEPKWP